MLLNLEELGVICHNANALRETEDLDMTLDAIYRHNLNRTIENPNTFPSLRTFQTNVLCRMTRKATFALDKETLVQAVVDRLPAIFRAGGRRGTHGWVASIVPTVVVGINVKD